MKPPAVTFPSLTASVKVDTDADDKTRVKIAAGDCGTEGDALLDKLAGSLRSSNTDINDVEEEGDFFKSITARIIIQPVVATLRRNAEFTFDYLIFIILAS